MFPVIEVFVDKHGRPTKILFDDLEIHPTSLSIDFITGEFTQVSFTIVSDQVHINHEEEETE